MMYRSWQREEALQARCKQRWHNTKRVANKDSKNGEGGDDTASKEFQCQRIVIEADNKHKREAVQDGDRYWSHTVDYFGEDKEDFPE